MKPTFSEIKQDVSDLLNKYIHQPQLYNSLFLDTDLAVVSMQFIKLQKSLLSIKNDILVFFFLVTAVHILNLSDSLFKYIETHNILYIFASLVYTLFIYISLFFVINRLFYLDEGNFTYDSLKNFLLSMAINMAYIFISFPIPFVNNSDLFYIIPNFIFIILISIPIIKLYLFSNKFHSIARQVKILVRSERA